MKNWFEEFMYFAVTTAVFIALSNLLIKPIEVHGESMEPNLTETERIIGLRVGTIERFDIVTFEAPDDSGTHYIKRVVGLPGELIAYHDDVLSVDGKAVAEDFMNEYRKSLGGLPMVEQNFSCQLGAGEYFVMGDNRRIAKDSRQLGLISQEQIVANGQLIYWPIEEFQWLP